MKRDNKNVFSKMNTHINNNGYKYLDFWLFMYSIIAIFANW